MAQAQISTDQPITSFVDIDWLVAHLDDPTVRVIEVDVSRARYDQGHIPGAVLWNAYSDLHHTDYSPIEKDQFERLLSSSGISPSSNVVFYGYAPYLGFWLMKSGGHEHVHVLNATRDGWVNGGHPLTTDLPGVLRSAYPLPAGEARAFMSLNSMRAAIGKPGQTIVDVRSQAEYEGDRFWPSGATEGAGRAGHIPGALHLPIELLRSDDGSFKSAEELGRVLSESGVNQTSSVITYCTVGGRAAEAWFVLSHVLDNPDVRVFLGSWAEWGTRTDTPIDTGSTNPVQSTSSRRSVSTVKG